CAPCAAFRGLGVLAGHTESVAAGLSRDGRVAVGWGRPGSDAPSQALRWELASGQVEALSDSPYSRAIGVNADGSVVVGYTEISDAQRDAYRWTRDAGWALISTNASALKVSADGNSVVGVHPLGTLFEAFRWTPSAGLVGLNSPFGLLASQALGISPDGALVLGQATSEAGNLQAVTWGAAGLQKLGGFPTETGTSYASASNADGSVLVGINGSRQALPAVFLWTPAGPVRLALGALSDSPPSTNLAGSVVVGTSRARAFVWEQRTGKAQPLHRAWGDLVPAGWLLLEATDVSEDGRVIVGSGRSPEHELEAWVGVLGPQCTGAEP
ncbi:MAG TPA: hypothetical protein VJU61_24310, partial [Polyangiaceae bacterium]|nr:hypothetical protein [Polyangiaceae bacterium]